MCAVLCFASFALIVLMHSAEGIEVAGPRKTCDKRAKIMPKNILFKQS